MGKGCPGRLESRPQARLESLPHIGHDTEGTEKTNHSAAEPQPNRCGGIKNPRARKRIYGLVVQRTRRRQTTKGTEDTEKNKPRRTRRTRRWGERGRVEVERGGVRATPPAVAAEGVGAPAQLGIVLLCRRVRRHGMPGGLLHGGGGDWVKEGSG